MLIGITYDLKDDYLAVGFSEEEAAEFDSVETIDSIESAIRYCGYDTERIGNIKALVKAIASGKRWDLIFNICEGVKGSAREAEVPSLLNAFGIPYVFSSAEVMVVTMDKSLAKRVVRDYGIPTADFSVVVAEEDISKIDLPFPLFVKPIAEGTSKGISAASIVHNRDELKSSVLQNLKKFSQPVLVETFLSGREFTVGITGTGKSAKITGVLEIKMKSDGEQGCYSYYNKIACKEVFEKADAVIAKEVAKVALGAWNALGCRDGGRVDVRMDDKGVPNFIEANPLAGLRPGFSEFPILADLHGVSYENLIGTIIGEARTRLKLPEAI